MDIPSESGFSACAIKAHTPLQECQSLENLDERRDVKTRRTRHVHGNAYAPSRVGCTASSMAVVDDVADDHPRAAPRICNEDISLNQVRKRNDCTRTIPTEDAGSAPCPSASEGRLDLRVRIT